MSVDFDFSSIESEIVEVSQLPTGQAAIDAANKTPVPAWLAESRRALMETGTGSTRKITVPSEEAANKAEQLIRTSANKINGTGARIRKVQGPNGSVDVYFRAATMRQSNKEKVAPVESTGAPAEAVSKPGPKGK